MQYSIISKENLQNIILDNFQNELIDTIKIVQFILSNKNIFIHNNDIIDEIKNIKNENDSNLLNEYAKKRNITLSELYAKLFNEIIDENLIIPFENRIPFLENIVIGDLYPTIHLECDVFLNEINRNVIEIDLRVRYYENNIENVTKLKNCNLKVDNNDGLLFDNPLYGIIDGQSEKIGYYTLVNILSDYKIKTFKEIIIYMIQISTERIKVKCGY